MLGSLLVDVGVGVVLLLVDLVANGILGGGGTAAEGGVVVLGDLLVGLLGSGRASALDGLRDVVGGVLDGLHCEDCGWFVGLLGCECEVVD